MKSPEIEKRHAELYSERMNEATWPGKDLWEIASLQVDLAAANKRIAELEERLNCKIVYCYKVDNSIAELEESRFRCVNWLKTQMELGNLNTLGTKIEARFWFQLPDSDEKREIEEILREGK